MNQPVFSIITPSYNRSNLLKTAIRSVIGQTFSDWEMIIVDDGSTDDTKDVVSSFNESRIKYIYQRNQGRSAARNTGLDHVKGSWICFLDSDDYYFENHLSILNASILENKIAPGIYYTGIYRDSGKHLFRELMYDKEKDINAVWFIWNNFIFIDSVCVHHSILEKNRFLDNYKNAVWEDTHLWLRIASEYPFFQIPVYTSAYVDHEDRSVSNIFKKIRISTVADYVSFVKDLFINHSDTISRYLTHKDMKDYIDSKYKMFLYQARQNRQMMTSLQIWTKAIRNKFSPYMISEVPKIFLNFLYIGLSKNCNQQQEPVIDLQANKTND